MWRIFSRKTPSFASRFSQLHGRLAQYCTMWEDPKAEEKSRKANLTPGSLRKPTPRKVRYEVWIHRTDKALGCSCHFRLGGREAGLVDALRPGVEQGCDRVLVRELQQPGGHAPVH